MPTMEEVSETLAEKFVREHDEDDRIQAAIDNLSTREIDPDAEAAMGAIQRAALLANEPDSPNLAALKKQVRRSPDNVWTIDAMRKIAPVTCDLYGDGTFIFTALPLINDVYCMQRMRLGDVYNAEKTNKTFLAMQIGYSEAAVYMIKSWPLRETVDDENGNPIYDKVVENGEEVEVLRTVPLAINFDNMTRLGNNLVVELLDSITDTMSGKAKGQPS